MAKAAHKIGLPVPAGDLARQRVSGAPPVAVARLAEQLKVAYFDSSVDSSAPDRGGEDGCGRTEAERPVHRVVQPNEAWRGFLQTEHLGCCPSPSHAARCNAGGHGDPRHRCGPAHPTRSCHQRGRSRGNSNDGEAGSGRRHRVAPHHSIGQVGPAAHRPCRTEAPCGVNQCRPCERRRADQACDARLRVQRTTGVDREGSHVANISREPSLAHLASTSRNTPGPSTFLDRRPTERVNCTRCSGSPETVVAQ